ncbi:hypothetical protein K3N28_20800 [Glycomyces sp. TRM65418]|uniref:hypothetical protein n=1 Tax=Glycomyces sp. TRM65418 TaxID=2867006 RepID=UPI001CE5138F|nr:hypothetical protein [Glycomyces sp. TRM65418]MCC3765504.1 hypothetical protein [Glycomyces sp. TRM65418]QZD55111.1 hypothetical protein K3N28_20695 [Glycomyces sp. TRM65418]
MVELRILSAGDRAAAVVHDRLAPRHDVLEETRRPDDFLWAVIADGESVMAAHRALIGHGRLYLRGVFTFQSTGFATAYTLARYLLGEARKRGIHGSHVWVETAGRERKIAELLGARTDPTPLHRFRLPASPRPGGRLRGASGTIDLPDAPRLDWLVDRSTTILFGPSGPDGLPGPVPFGEAIALPWSELAATPFVELPVPASDIPATLDLLGRGAKRMNRCTVLHGAVAPEAP